MIHAAVRRGVDPAPSNIGLSDVNDVEAATSAMRALDYHFGGGACRDAVVAQLSWALRLLGASGKEEVRQRLFRALADLQNLRARSWASQSRSAGGCSATGTSPRSTGAEFTLEDQGVVVALPAPDGTMVLAAVDGTEAEVLRGVETAGRRGRVQFYLA